MMLCHSWTRTLTPQLSGLSPEQTRVLPSCDVFWRRQSNHFVGYMTPNACSYVSSESGKRIIFNDDLLLTEEALWFSDRAQDEEGNRVFGHPTGVPHKNRKARRFECWMTAMRKRSNVNLSSPVVST